MRFGIERVLRAAVRVTLAATALLLVVAFAQPRSFLVIAAPLFVNMACGGFILPNATVGALSRHAGHAGSASAVMGTMTFMLAAVSGLLVGVASDGTARPMAALLVLGALCATVADLRRPRPR
jgi:DHA1 family bicyclomycin/chloramphenicol resistance-like MFS transporter